MLFEADDTLWLLVHVGTGYRDLNTAAFYRIKAAKFHPTTSHEGAWGGVVVKALRYSSEGPGIDPRSLGIFSGASDSSMCPGV